MGCLFSQDVEHDSRSEVELIEKEVAGIDGCDSERRQHLIWEVAEVGGDDRVSPATHRRCEDVTVIRVRKREQRLERLPTLDARILEGVLHGGKPPGDDVWCQLGVDVEHRVGGFAKDPL